MSAEPEDTYAPNEPCLCYHLNLLYEARVLEVKDSSEIPDDKFETPGKRYKVHYKGWKSSWDEYVPANRLLKTNETNMTLMKRLAKDERAKTGASSGPKRARESTSVSRPAKRMREEESNLPQPEMRLQVSDVLKIVLVDDWEMVRSNKLVSLPRSPNVDTLLKEFEEYVKGSKEHSLKEPELLAHTVVTGIRIYFDRTLGTQLLYMVERPQYAEVRKHYITGQTVIVGEEPEMSEIYGAEHLLRMLVALPNMINMTDLDSGSISLVQDYVNELLRWLEQEKTRVFLKDYKLAGTNLNVVKR